MKLRLIEFRGPIVPTLPNRPIHTLTLPTDPNLGEQSKPGDFASLNWPTSMV